MPAPQLRPPDPPELPGSNLFSDEVMEALTDEERKFGLYTGARCPIDKRNDIIQFAGEGRKVDEIRRVVHVHRETVINVMNEFAAEIADYEKRVTAKLRRCKWLLMDRIEREGDAIPRQALGLTFKIVSDQEATDSGRAIARVDHVHRVDLFSDFPAFIAELEARPVMDGKNAAGIHLDGGKNLPLPASSADLEAIDVEACQDPPAGPASDWKSDVSGLPTQQDQATLPTFSTDSAAAAADFAALAAAERDRERDREPERDRDRDREGGGSRAAAPTNPTKDNGSQKFLANGL
jgi:hypothetical protein